MNPNDQSPRDRGSVADQNVERLLAQAYDPEMPDPGFVQRVGQRVLEESSRRNKTSQDRAARGAGRSWRSSLRWQSPLWVVATLLLILLAFAVVAKWRNSPGVHREGNIVWIDGAPFVPADAESPGTPGERAMRPFGGSAASARPPLRAARLVGNHGLTPRPRAAAARPAAVGVGQALSTNKGERRRVTLPDGSTLFMNENSRVAIDGRRTITLSRGHIFLAVAPRAAAAQGATFIVKTPEREVKALGTRFAVQVAGDRTSVLVAQGKVKVDGVKTAVGAGQQLELDRGGGAESSPVPAPRLSHLLNWTKELLVASESPLVPAGDYDGGALIAVDPQGQNTRLSLRKYHVDVYIQDGFARTTIDQTYFNHQAWRMEGTFYFPLPADASISRLAMYVNGRLMEGGMCERDYARDVFETIKHRSLDPALLEWVDGSTFKMRVFPLEGRQEKRIVLSYIQRLDTDYGRTRYRFPAGHSMDKVRDWSVQVRVADGANLPWQCDSHDLQSTIRDGDLLLAAEAKNIEPRQDIVLELSEPDTASAAGPGQELLPGSASRATARFSTATHEDRRYLMVRFCPQLEARASSERRDWIFLFDSDGSRDPLSARVQIDVVRGLLDSAEHDDRFAIVAAGTRVHGFAAELREATAANIAEATTFLESRHLLGALDLEKAFDACHAYAAAADNPVLVHVGAGVPILGERRVNVLLKKLPPKARYVGVGVGKRWNRSLMKAAAGQTGGYFTQINPDEPVSWRTFELMSTLNAPRLLNLRVEADSKECVFLACQDTVIHGQEICAIARLEKDVPLPKTVHIRGSLDGEPYARTIEVGPVEASPVEAGPVEAGPVEAGPVEAGPVEAGPVEAGPVEAGPVDAGGYLPRAWAKLAIDGMVARDAAKFKSEIVALSKAMYVMSPFTSLLVLENDQMYEQYKVDRGRKDHWALYACPQEIKVIHEPLPKGQATPVPDEPTEEKVSPRDVLQSLLVRHSRFGYATPTLAWLGSVKFHSVSSTVTVPDGGTVLLGGIRRASTFNPSGGIIVFSDGSRETVREPLASYIWDAESNGVPVFGEFDPSTGFIRRAFIDLAGELPAQDEVNEYFLSVDWDKAPPAADFDDLIRLITTTMGPNTWDQVGGPGEITGFEGNLSLVVSQTQSVHNPFPLGWVEKTVYPVGDLVVPVNAHRGAFGAALPMTDGTVNSLSFITSVVPRMGSSDSNVWPTLSDWQQLTRGRKRYQSIDLARSNSSGNEITAALDDETHFEFDGEALENIVEFISDCHGIPVEIDTKTLDDVGVSTDTPVTCNLSGISLRSALRLVLNKLELTYGIHDGVLLITTRDGLAAASGYGREEFLLPLRTGGPRAARLDGPSEGRTTRPLLDPLNDRRFLGMRLRRLTARFGRGLKQPELTYFQPAMGHDRRPFRHLLAYAPGINTTHADVLALVEREAALSDAPQPGRIDEAARRLIDTARGRGWQSVVLRDEAGRELLRVQIDGEGRFRLDRETEHGLREEVVCDGETLWHLYPELGLGSRRAMSRFHRGDVAALVPWYLSPAEELAIGADLRMIGRRTVAVVPHDGRDAKGEDGQPAPYARVHLVFARDGRLAERRLVLMPDGATLARITYGEDGEVRLLDRDGKTRHTLQLTVETIAAPNLKPAVDQLVVLPMPVRDRSHVIQSVADAPPTSDSEEENDVLQQIVDGQRADAGDVTTWNEEDALRLIAANHWQDAEHLQSVIARRFFARGDRRIGFYTLLLSSGFHWDADEPVEFGDGTTVRMNPTEDFPKLALARYIATQLELDKSFTSMSPVAVEVPQDGFIAQLAEYRRLYALWGGAGKRSKDVEQLRRDLDGLFDFVDRCDSPTFAFTLLRRVQHQLGNAQPHGRIADALLRFEQRGITSYVVQYELARSLWSSGDKQKARLLFLRLYRGTIDQGILPPIDQVFLQAVNSTDDKPLDGAQDPFDSAQNPFDEDGSYTGRADELLTRVGLRLVAERRRPLAVALALQCKQLGQTTLADRLLELALSGTPEEEQIGTTLAALEYLLLGEQFDRADALLEPLRQDEATAELPSLWRLAARIAHDGGMLARSLHYRERAVALEFEQFDSTVDLEWMRNEYGDILNRYNELASIVAGPGSQTADDLVAGVVKAADQWRALDTDVTSVCNTTARVLNTLGRKELAWDYLTTPLALKPNEAAPWSNLADTLRSDRQFGLADRAYHQAFEAEPTNAEILWTHARMLDEHGQSRQALKIYEQIADGDWQPRFRSVHNQARQIVERYGARREAGDE